MLRSQAGTARGRWVHPRSPWLPTPSGRGRTTGQADHPDRCHPQTRRRKSFRRHWRCASPQTGGDPPGREPVPACCGDASPAWAQPPPSVAGSVRLFAACIRNNSPSCGRARSAPLTPTAAERRPRSRFANRSVHGHPGHRLLLNSPCPPARGQGLTVSCLLLILRFAAQQQRRRSHHPRPPRRGAS